MSSLILAIIVTLIQRVICEHVNGYIQGVSEYSSPYNSIIFKDMVDVINEFDNSLNSRFDENDSENIDDLLSQYKHFLDRARDQRKYIAEKTKNVLPHNKYNNGKPNVESNNEYYNSYRSDNNNYNPASYNLASNIFYPNKNRFWNNFTNRHLQIASPYNIISSCFCQDNKFPCKCGCKQCIVPFKPIPLLKKLSNMTPDSPNLYDQIFLNNKYSDEETLGDVANDKLTINMNVDVKFPKTFQIQVYPHMTDLEDQRQINIFRKQPMNGLFKHIAKPISETFEFNNPNFKNSILEGAKKFTVYKKKKGLNKITKKRKNKKIITIHDIYLDAPLHTNITQKNPTTHKKCNGTSPSDNCVNSKTNVALNTTKIINNNSNIVMQTKTTVNPFEHNDTPTESVYVFFNISTTTDNITEDFQKLGNSIEEIDKLNTRSKTRVRREINALKDVIKHKSGSQYEAAKAKNLTKLLTSDDELLYWPSSYHNNNTAITNNITSLILERERKKTRLNITQDVIQKNRTVALERAIFGDIDWNDMDAVVPVFISFIGKYIRGILTFCCETMCHSMKCIEKECLHRVCLPEERFNLKGHCTGRNDTDSLATLNSIMDLPSNIALEVVDILEDRLLGKVFGKATLCIGPKCVTFVASKKYFVKSKCTSKELSSSGHCPITQVM